MRKRADFLRAQKGYRQPMPGLTLETCLSPPVLAKPRTARVGFTASRKVGGAVERNRAKRRLRAVAAATLPLSGRQGHDYVLIARTATLLRPFGELTRDLEKALRTAHAAIARAGTAPLPQRRGRRDPKEDHHG
ncbi:MAG TPA: ribonuclease P protein component [Micropepsaceae bacterium]|jgi:ribonuclease P protein component